MDRTRARPALLALWGFVAACASAAPATTAPARSPLATEPAAESGEAATAGAGFFTEEQAERGRTTFREICSECHYSSEFRGSQFAFEWRRRTARDLFRTVSRTMPDDAPGSLASSQYADVVSYILRLNGLPAGERELPDDAEALRAYSLAGLGRSGG